MGLVNNADGTLTDESNGLMWQVDEDGEEKKYGQALAYCHLLDLAGYDDWRLPKKEELQLLAKVDFQDLQKLFPSIQDERYWAESSEDELWWAENPGKIAYIVDFDPDSSNYGRAITYFRVYSYFVRAVRTI